MNKKIIISIVVVLFAILAGGGFWFIKNNSQREFTVNLNENKDWNNEHYVSNLNSANNCSEDEKKILKKHELDCNICPGEGDVFPKWCNIDQLKKQPDCLFNFCGEGGIDLGNNYKKYKNKIYYWHNGPQAVPGMSLINADFNTFQSFGDNNYNYGKDNEKVFVRNWKIEGADPATFELMKYDDGNMSLYSKDKKFVFYDGKKISGADPITFKIYNNSDIARDKFNCYRGEYAVNSDLCNVDR